MTKRTDDRYQVKVTTREGPRFVYGKTQAEAKGKADEMRERMKEGARFATPAVLSATG
jgi:integrase